VVFSPQANYTNRATAACQRSYCQLLRIEGVAWLAQWIPTAVNLGFLDRSRYFSFQVAPQLFSRCWVDRVPDPLLLRKPGRAGNRTRNLWICSQELWPLDGRGGLYILLLNEIYLLQYVLVFNENVKFYLGLKVKFWSKIFICFICYLVTFVSLFYASRLTGALQTAKKFKDVRNKHDLTDFHFDSITYCWIDRR
jgi:hypothetical protein